jgi:DsbC/DsbD-like thiol-disulfide interchange protein
MIRSDRSPPDKAAGDSYIAGAMKRFLLAAISVSFAALAALAPAQSAQSDWAVDLQSRLRLLLVPGEDGELAGGVEIALEPGWHTYWRAPGEAGIPPQLDFSGSENVASLEVHYPVPERYDDGASLSLVYFDQVVFPLSVVPADPARPVRLRLNALYGVCEVVCIPARAEASVMLAPGAPDDPLARVTIREARRSVPGPPIAGRLAVEQIRLAGEALEIAVTVPPEGPVDLFAEGPADWYLGQPKLVSRDASTARFRLSLAGMPADSRPQGRTFRFVAVAGGEAVAQEVSLEEAWLERGAASADAAPAGSSQRGEQP